MHWILQTWVNEFPYQASEMKQVVLNRDGQMEGGMVSVREDVNAGELFPLVGPSCNDKI